MFATSSNLKNSGAIPVSASSVSALAETTRCSASARHTRKVPGATLRDPNVDPSWSKSQGAEAAPSPTTGAHNPRRAAGPLIKAQAARAWPLRITSGRAIDREKSWRGDSARRRTWGFARTPPPAKSGCQSDRVLVGRTFPFTAGRIHASRRDIATPRTAPHPKTRQTPARRRPAPACAVSNLSGRSCRAEADLRAAEPTHEHAAARTKRQLREAEAVS